MLSCKCKCPESWKGDTSEVFSPLETLDHYDGLVTGIAKCPRCASSYLISMISWRPSVDWLRIFGVAQVPSEQFTTIQILLNESRAQSDGEKPELAGDYEDSLSKLLRESPSPYAILASVALEKEILSARSLSDDGVRFEERIERISAEKFAHWISFLGIKS